jgi:hypothetical protein
LYSLGGFEPHPALPVAFRSVIELLQLEMSVVGRLLQLNELIGETTCVQRRCGLSTRHGQNRCHRSGRRSWLGQHLEGSELRAGARRVRGERGWLAGRPVTAGVSRGVGLLDG